MPVGSNVLPSRVGLIDIFKILGGFENVDLESTERFFQAVRRW